MMVRVGLVCVQICTVVHAVCLPDTQEDSKHLTIQGVNQPLQIWPLNWPSSGLVSNVMMIIATDVLGYHTTLGHGSGVSASAIHALARCDPDENVCLAELASEFHHLSFETWPNGQVRSLVFTWCPLAT